MPIHDWSRVDAGVFHHFHQTWIIEICNTLNAGRLPPGFFALAEQVLSGPIPDVVTPGRCHSPINPSQAAGGVAVADRPPKARFVTSAEVDRYARKANRILIKHPLGAVVAVIEIVSPGNKSSGHAVRSFVRKAEDLLRQGVQPAGRRPVPAVASRSARHSQGDLGRNPGAAVRVATRQAARGGRVRGRRATHSLRRAGGGRRCAAGHAHPPRTGDVRSGTAAEHVRSSLE